MPSSVRRALAAGLARICTIAAFSLATASLGVPLGTHSPYHSEAKKPGRPASSADGIFGDDGSRVLPVAANGVMLPAATSDLKFADGSIMKPSCPASKSRIAGALQ